MQNPVKQSELSGHAHRLRQIFGKRFESRSGEPFLLYVPPLGGDKIHLMMKANGSTVDAINEREGTEICGVLARFGERRVLCSIFESWSRAGKSCYRFDQAAMTFFLKLGCKPDFPTKQLFRLEWEDCEQKKQNKAAYPHWQFDRWLTASDRESIDDMKARFTDTDRKARVFENVIRGQEERSRPNLAWFTKLHFPAIAPWGKDPIVNLDEERQPHRMTPDSIEEVENWIDSALCYIASELGQYAA